MQHYLVTVKQPKDKKFIRKVLVTTINLHIAIEIAKVELMQCNIAYLEDSYTAELYKNQSLKAKYVIDARNNTASRR